MTKHELILPKRRLIKPAKRKLAVPTSAKAKATRKKRDAALAALTDASKRKGATATARERLQKARAALADVMNAMRERETLLAAKKG